MFVKCTSTICRIRSVVDGNKLEVTTPMLYSWCEQIASGMGYLASKQV